MLKRQHVTAQEDKLALVQKLGYGMGALVSIVSVNTLMNLTTLFYVDMLKISPILMAWAAAIPRVWDAVSDPLVGSISDNTRSRFGRRIPYILAGGVLVGITFAIIFMVPGNLSEKEAFTYFLVTSLIFYTSVTIYSVPHGALGFEMTDDYHERTNLFAYSSFVGNIGAIASPWLYFFAQRDWFDNEIQGMRWVCIIMGGILIISAVVCAVTCKEKKFDRVKKQAKIKLWENFSTTCKNLTFIRLVAAFVLVIIGFQFVMGFTNFITIYYVFAGDKDAASKLLGLNGSIWAVTALIGVFPMAWLSARLGKTRTVMLSFALLIIANLLKIVCYNPDYPYLTIIPTVLLAWGMVMCFTLVNAMNADICDEDELKTGKRREAAYFAVYGWWWKAAVSIAVVISGYLLSMTGYDAELSTQTDSAMYWLRFAEIVLPSVLCLISIVLLVKYPLNEDRAYEVKEILAQRRQIASGESEPKE